MAEKIVNKDGVVIKRTNPFTPYEHKVDGLSGFEDEYETIKIVDVVKKTGEGENDFVIQKKVLVEKTKIQDVIDQDKDNVGVDNIIKQVLRTGDTSLLPVDDGKCNVDLVGAPETLMEVKQVGVDAEKAFKGLPAELVDGMDMTSFVNSMSQEKFDQFIKAVAERQKAAVGKEPVGDGK